MDQKMEFLSEIKKNLDQKKFLDFLKESFIKK